MISQMEIVFQLLLASFLGGLIGVERERKSWFAGLRTHMLVCMGSTLVMIVSQYGFEYTLHQNLVVLDPSRIAAQVVSGIGFLGAGTILFWKNRIRGLTTAASLWAVAAVGLAIGGKLYLAAIATTALILVVLAGIKPLEKFFSKTNATKEIKFTIEPGISLMKLEECLISLKLRTSVTDMQMESDGKKELIHLVFNCPSEVSLYALVDEIKRMSGVEKVHVIE
jgi:putative Mg2+ transporter-C (MgtC) family protein